MRMMLNVSLPVAEFNAAVRDGSVSEKIGRILEETKPEAVYFSERNGQRFAVVIVDVPEPSSIPSLAEPWFLNFNAGVEFHVAMKPEDIQKAGLPELGKKWA